MLLSWLDKRDTRKINWMEPLGHSVYDQKWLCRGWIADITGTLNTAISWHHPNYKEDNRHRESSNNTVISSL